MEDQTAFYNDDLELYLKQINQLFNVSNIINKPQGKPQIINYYMKSKLPYRLGYSWEGFLHCGISYDGKYNNKDLKEPAKIVEGHIRDSNAKNVLELAYGLGANSAFLARRNPLVTFEGVDLSNKPLRRYTKIPNLHLQLGDYHGLSAFEDNAYDVAFVIESLCHSTNKMRVLREVKKKLRRGGVFIVMDGYKQHRDIPLSQSENIMWKLIEKSVSVDKFESVEDVEGYMREIYSIAESKDITQYVLPSIVRSESPVRYYFAHPLFAKAVNKFLAFDIVKNALAVLLWPISVRRQIGCYFIHVLKNHQ